MCLESVWRKTRLGLPWSLVALLLSTACASPQNSSDAPLEILVASSMQDVFRDLEKEFETRHPGADVLLTVAGSQVLRLQVEAGGGGDVFVSANRAHVDALTRIGQIDALRPLAEGQLALVVSPLLKNKVKRFEDITQIDRLVVGTASVPIGAYSEELLRRSESTYGIEFAQTLREKIVSRESNVRLVRTKVLLGEADAALVYESDARHVAGLYVIDIPPNINVKTTHWLATLQKQSPHPQRNAFVQFIHSPMGQRLLGKHGFAVER